MTHTLGIDIGTFESKGVLVETATGRIVAEARHPHRMLVPQPGWAEHRAEEDWWGDTVRITSRSSPRRGSRPKPDRLRRDQRHRPLHAAGGCGRARR
jgi:xylulokinase